LKLNTPQKVKLSPFIAYLSANTEVCCPNIDFKGVTGDWPVPVGVAIQVYP
jgi:hypothetical protein